MNAVGERTRETKLWAAVFLLLFLLYRWLVPLIPVPLESLRLADTFSTILFLGLPIAFVYQWARLDWPVLALATTLVGCVGVVVLAGLLGGRAPSPLLIGLQQTALIVGAGSIGLMVSRIVRDPNLLLPIAPVLALVDIMTVLSPIGFVKQVMEHRPEVFEAVAVSVPRFGTTAPYAYMGPADVLFLAMFFAVIHRAGFRSRATILWLIPTLILYMCMVIFLGGVKVGRLSLDSLPALVPMGIVILAVNWKCFTLSRQEKIMTAVLVVGAVGLAAYALSLPTA